MLRLFVDSDGKPKVIQENAQPTVYFDHWALMTISMNDKLVKKFIETLKKRNGTFALSWVNLLEYSKITDNKQIKAVELFVNKIIPNLFFINPQPWEVIDSVHSDPHQSPIRI